MRTKFNAHISDALKYSFLETPISNAASDIYLTDEERFRHQESKNLA